MVIYRCKEKMKVVLTWKKGGKVVDKMLLVISIIIIIIGLCSDAVNHNMKYPESTNPNVIRNKKACDEIIARVAREKGNR